MWSKRFSPLDHNFFFSWIFTSTISATVRTSYIYFILCKFTGITNSLSISYNHWPFALKNKVKRGRADTGNTAFPDYGTRWHEGHGQWHWYWQNGNTFDWWIVISCKKAAGNSSKLVFATHTKFLSRCVWSECHVEYAVCCTDTDQNETCMTAHRVH